MSALAARSQLPIRPTADAPSAYLLRFPETIWEQICSHVGSASISMQNGRMSICLGDSVVPLDANATGIHTEVHALTSDALVQVGSAAVRLSVPLLSQQAVPPVVESVRQPSLDPNPPPPPLLSQLPLKTRVVQVLALGEVSMADVARRVGAEEDDIARIVSIVGKKVQDDPPLYSLPPPQFSKVKFAGYAPDELVRVARSARAAFDELGLALDAAERSELEDKVKEAQEGAIAIPQPASPVASVRSDVHTAPSLTTRSAVTPRSPAARSDATASPVARKPKAKGLLAREKAKFKAERDRSRPSTPSVTAPKATKSKRRRESRTPQFTSSEEEDEGKPDEGKPDEGKPDEGKPGDGKPDVDKLRDRYEELYPAYQLLTSRLVALQQAAETGDTGDEDAGKLVQKWQRWHAELASIRSWFGA